MPSGGCGTTPSARSRAARQGSCGTRWCRGWSSWIVDSVAWFVGQVLSLLEDSTKVDLRVGWFLDPGGPYRTVLGIAAALLLGFVFLGLLQGLLAGDPMVMLTRIVRDLPLAVLGMVVTIEVTTRLLQLADALSHAVLRGGGDNAKEVLRVISSSSAFSGQSSFVVALLGLLCIVAALFVWVELVVRAALVYLLIAFSPLVFAAMVWPSARGMVRKLVRTAPRIDLLEGRDRRRLLGWCRRACRCRQCGTRQRCGRRRSPRVRAPCSRGW